MVQAGGLHHNAGWKPAPQCRLEACGAANKNPVVTGVSANKHGGLVQKEMVPRGGIEPPTRGFSVRNDTNEPVNKDGGFDDAGEPVRTHSAQNDGLDVVLTAIQHLSDEEKLAVLSELIVRSKG